MPPASAPLRRPPLFVLVVAGAVQPFAINVLAPSTPALSRTMNVDYGTVQLTLSVYLLAVALTQLLVGPISDRIGRRPCVVGSLALFTFGSFVGAAADSMAMLLFARILQAAGAGTAFALTRAIVRDIAGKDEAASLIGYVTMALVVAPMIAPLAGGFIDAHYGWRAIFLAMAAMGAAATALSFFQLPETLRRDSDLPPGGGGVQWLSVFAAFPTLARERAFVGNAVAVSMTSITFFMFIAGAPYVVIEHMGRTSDVYGLYFILNACSYMVGNFLSGRFSRVYGSERLVDIGLKISVVTVLFSLAFPLLGLWTPATLFLPLLLNGIGNGLTMPGATAGGLSARPDLAGAASGLLGFLQLGMGALGAWLTGLLTPLWPPALIVLMLVCVIIANLGYRLCLPRASA